MKKNLFLLFCAAAIGFFGGCNRDSGKKATSGAETGGTTGGKKDDSTNKTVDAAKNKEDVSKKETKKDKDGNVIDPAVRPPTP